jgi:hypothetical protein
MCLHVARRLNHGRVNVRLEAANVSALIVQTDETINADNHGHDAVAVTAELADGVA